MLYDVGDLAWHPDFNFASMDNDIAILWLPKPVMFGDTVEAIEMVETNSEIPDGDITIVTGWGHMEVKYVIFILSGFFYLNLSSNTNDHIAH